MFLVIGYVYILKTTIWKRFSLNTLRIKILKIIREFQTN